MNIPTSETVIIPNFIDYKEYKKQYQNTEKCLQKQEAYIKNVERIIAIGDIHGDYNALLASLYEGKVINEKGEWIGDNTIVVQVGDILDKGGRGQETSNKPDDSEWRIILYLEYLQQQAKIHGGDIYLLLGNHEIMNIQGDFRYTTKGTLDYFGGLDGRREAFKIGGIVTQKIACMTNAIVKLGSWVFVHAGIVPDALRNYKNSNLNKLNKDIRDYLIDNIDNATKSKILDLFSDNDGFLWTRAFGNDDVDCNLLNKALSMEILNKKGHAGGLIVGHTPQMYTSINGKCNNKLFAIDKGLSEAFGKDNYKRLEVLEIINDKVNN